MRSLFLLLLILALRMQGGPVYLVTNLGGSSGGSASQAKAVNSSGTVVGSGRDESGVVRPFRHQGSAPVALAGGPGQAAGVNDSGVIVGTTEHDGKPRATIWRTSTPEFLLGLGGDSGYAMGINNAGDVVGSSTTAGGLGHAYLYSNSGEIQDLTPDVDWSSAYSVNDARQVAGTYMSSGSFRAFVWEGTTGMRNIGPSAVQNSYAMDINNDGYVTGTAVGLDGVQRGYLYSAGSGSLLFDGLGSGRSFGYGLNSRNDVVGNYYDHIGDSRAFVWIRGTMLDLTSLVEDANWVLESAYDINDAGQIVGRGRYQGQETAFRLDFANQVVYEETPASGDAAVPEPATGLLAVCGAAVMLFHKKLAKLQ